ncbi:unnamed protein product, partial [Tenebrio molitor]
AAKKKAGYFVQIFSTVTVFFTTLKCVLTTPHPTTLGAQPGCRCQRHIRTAATW